MLLLDPAPPDDFAREVFPADAVERDDLDCDLVVGRDLRGVEAMSFNSRSDMELAICLDAPLSFDLGASPRLAAKAAPAAICRFLDRAGMDASAVEFWAKPHLWREVPGRFGPAAYVAEKARVACFAAKGTCTPL